jgi:hypothetical protein
LETILELPLREASETVFLGKGKITRILGVALASALMLGGAFSLSTKAPEKVGATSYDIATESDFNNYFNGGAQYYNCDFNLTSDITITTTWTVCRMAGAYTGTFNGNGHTISGITMSSGNTNFGGMFNIVGSAGTVENLTLAGTINNNYQGILGFNNDGGHVTGVTCNITVTGAYSYIGAFGIVAAPGLLPIVEPTDF